MTRISRTGACFPDSRAFTFRSWSGHFNGAAPTDTQFDTVDISRQYDGFTDFPLYPLNVISLLNAVLGMFYVHA